MPEKPGIGTIAAYVIVLGTTLALLIGVYS